MAAITPASCLDWPGLSNVTDIASRQKDKRPVLAKGIERLVRNDMWKGRSQERYYDALEWLYGWNADNCLAA